MNTGLKRTNEELVVTYRATRNEQYLEELINQNKGLMYMIVEPFVHSIPNSELEDLTSEAYIPSLYFGVRLFSRGYCLCDGCGSIGYQ